MASGLALRQGSRARKATNSLLRLGPWLLISTGLMFLLPLWLDGLGVPPLEAAGGAAERQAPPFRPTQWLGGLAIIAGLLWVLPAWLGKLGQGARPGPTRIEILEVRALSRHERLILARVEGRRLLLGSSQAGLSALADWQGEASPRSVKAESTAASPGESEFGWLLRVARGAGEGGP